jgi:hypothetical protein
MPEGATRPLTPDRPCAIVACCVSKNSMTCCRPCSRWSPSRAGSESLQLFKRFSCGNAPGVRNRSNPRSRSAGTVGPRAKALKTPFQNADQEGFVAAASAVTLEPPVATPLTEDSIPRASCPKCGSHKVIPRVLDRDGEAFDKSLSVRIDRNPQALLFKGSEVVELRAWICGLCGFAELYVTQPALLWSAFQEQTKT